MTRIAKIKSLIEEIGVGKVDLDSNLIQIPFRHYEYELNSKTSPLIWHITANDNSKTIKIFIEVDKNTLPSKNEADNIIIDTIRNNEDFRDLVKAISQFSPNNKDINTIYKLNTWSIKDSENDIKYIKNIQLGA